ncbi:cytochrome C oxidase subunit IV family protein [Methylonatrum kenyense]|uniref:cytochrome C oxidase subunit IV family protein n=1 Tax=Methylonatrum kenyense TaxID=455253 RepID=UPI0020BDA4B9|nr:cytochrome C oxidase subunit IV family protein [Methylonatrum kenyense]MCK8515161.1 cytochrome C oxidase subunit IV family protein [Methylonatrum kenyense]
MTTAQGQQHPISLYLQVWGWLFVLSFFSYLVDYNDLQGFWRWSLVLLFMSMKATLIVAVFMHMRWERLSLIYAILVPPLAMLTLILFLAAEGGYISALRAAYPG